MKQTDVEKLLALLPEGSRKEALVRKLNELQKEKDSSKGGGLQDSFQIEARGDILIEEIDKEGEAVGVLADQKNLVVNGAEEILLRSFSGDPKRMLYKNRIPKNGVSKVFHTDVAPIIDSNSGENIVPHHANELWKDVEDDDFDIVYSYYPNTVYVEEVTATEPDKKAFKISKQPNASTAPLGAEVYSTYTNLFIGLGDGVDYAVPLTDERLTFSEGFSGDDNRQESATQGDTILFEEKVSRFSVSYEKSNKGGQLEVKVDDVVLDTIETYDSSLADGEVVVASYEKANLDHTKASTVEVNFTGADADVTNPVVAVTEIRLDSFEKKMNGLIHEFENVTKDFQTATVYNTTAVAPYTIQLEHFPVADGTVSIQYGETAFEEVDAIENLTEGTFFVDTKSGKVHFNRALTGLNVKYSITGQLIEDELANALAPETKTIAKEDVAPEGAIDGSNTTFTLEEAPSNLVLSLDGTELEEGEQADYTVADKEITLATAPTSEQVLLASYSFDVEVLVFETEHSVNAEKELDVVADDDLSASKATDVEGLKADGAYFVDPEAEKRIYLSVNKADGKAVQSVTVYYHSDGQGGLPTDYRRQIALKPKNVNDYPWFALDKGSVEFVAEFHETVPNHNVMIREMGMFDGPRQDDGVQGFPGYPVHAFSLVRVGETRKDIDTGIRVSWTITLMNENHEPLEGG